MQDQDRVFVKCALRLIPFVSLLYFLNLLDRVNVGFAALTMNKDLGFSPGAFGFGAGVLFIGYAIFVIPSSVFLQRIGARRGVFVILASWGLLSAACAFVQGTTSFYVLRFFLGIAEAGFIPGMFYYLSLWFPQAYRGRAIAVFMLGGSIANIFGSPLSAALLGLENVAGLHGWQWLFLVEGLPAFLLSFVALKLLPDNPAQAPWLDANERAVIAARMAADPPAEHADLLAALMDPRVLLLGLAWFGIYLSVIGLDIWLPQIVQGHGFSNIETGFIAAAIFASGVVGQVLNAHSSDKKRERIWHVALPALAAAAGWLIAAGIAPSSVIVAVLALAVVRAGITGTYGPFLSLLLVFLRGPAAAGAVALVAAIGALGGFFGPALMGTLKQQTGGYAAGMMVLALGLVSGAAIVLALKRSIEAGKEARPLKTAAIA